MKREMNIKISEANNIKDLQGQSGNWDCDEYMHGLYNGMEMVMSIIEEREPVFKDAPKRWLKDNPKSSSDTSILASDDSNNTNEG